MATYLYTHAVNKTQNVQKYILLFPIETHVLLKGQQKRVNTVQWLYSATSYMVSMYVPDNLNHM